MKAVYFLGVVFAVALLAVAAGIGLSPEPIPDVALTKEMAQAMTTLIQSTDYNCPLVKLVRHKGEDVDGTVMKVWCGPTSGDGINQNLVYRVAMRPSGEWTVRPWD